LGGAKVSNRRYPPLLQPELLNFVATVAKTAKSRKINQTIGGDLLALLEQFKILKIPLKGE
jgi:hypothetical protein